MSRTPKPPHVAPRGVYLAAFTANGDRHYYSVTSQGERLRVIASPIGSDPMEAIDELWSELEREDPITDEGGDGPSAFSLRLA